MGDLADTPSDPAPSRASRAGWLLLLLLPLGLAALLAGRGPDGGRTVVVYTAMSSEDVGALLPAFEAATGIRAEPLLLGSGEALQRILAERERPACDVVFGVSPDQLEAHAGLLEPWSPPEAGRELDPALPGGQRWSPWSGLVLALIVNERLCPPERAPRGWRDLADPRLQGQVALARPDKSGSSYMHLAAVLERLGEQEGWEVVAGITRNAQLAASSSAVPRLVNDGEAAVGLTLEDAAWRYVAGGGPVRLVHPVEGTAVAADGVALVAGAPHPEEARAFVAWALSREAQTLLATRVGRRPVRRDVPPPEGLPGLEALGAVPYPLARASAAQPDVLARWRETLAAVGK